MQEAQGAGKAKLDGKGRAQKTGDDAEGQTEVQSAAGVDHRHHGQHHDGVPAEAVDGVADLGPEIRAYEGRRDKQEQQEGCNNESRQAEVFRKDMQPVAYCQIGSV